MPVSVHGGEGIAPGNGKAGPAKALPSGPVDVADTVDTRIGVPGLSDAIPGAVGAGVIDEDEFEFDCPLFHGVRHLFGKSQDVILLVIDGDNDR